MREHAVAVVAGDGIGLEVVPAARQVLDRVAEIHGGFRLTYREFPWSCRYYLEHGAMMPEDGLETLRPFDAIFLGAVGFPGVPDHVSLWGLLLPIRREFRQYVNLRPIKLLRGIASPLRDRGPEEIDFLCVRENNEGEYSNMGGRLYRGTPQELAVQNTVFTRFGVERILHYAFRLARERGRIKRVTAATKSNGINYTMPFWDEVFEEVATQYPDVEHDRFHVDALAARFVTDPAHFGVVVASNLFGDILTDLGAAIAGSIGVAPSANLNPEGTYPSMFEPVHGSAPDIAGRGVANPIAQVWSGAMMLDHLGYPEAHGLIVGAIERALLDGIRTRDLGGAAGTVEMTQAILDRLEG
ncbi:tartrate dehydrogenase [Limnochorda pilosa]|uniref:D-malate dehydrogenase (decarboxylating) n=1 Tax=Limnochorda pilosa TaxID=1555112 RepID=A0A0K2SJ93_LIMPI|nr:tartrate dehydrogenase [Limnochorda pilosa]BAS27163.1 tartrate dehydrogenase [Limnochorda pilosa]